jgi:hypothetical protein
VACNAYLSSNQTGLNPNNTFVKINLNATTVDTVNAFGSNKYTVIVPGIYKISPSIQISGTNVLNNQYALAIYKNGASAATFDTPRPAVGTSFGITGSTILNLVAGDYIEMYLYGQGNNSVSTLTVTTSTIMCVERLAGPNQIAATETVAARYSNSSGQSIPNGSPATITGWTKDYDLFGSFNPTTGVFSAPISGQYSFSLVFLMASASFGSGNVVRASIYKNGSQHSIIAFYATATTTSQYAGGAGSGDVNLIAGDTVEIKIEHSESTARSIFSSAVYNHLSIKRVK